MFGIFAHGNVAGLGQALEEYGLEKDPRVPLVTLKGRQG